MLLKKLLKMLFVLFMLNQLNGCSSSGTGTECQVGTYCDSANTTWEACCTSSECWYVAGSRTFPCSGLSCYTAASDLADYCVYGKPSAESENELIKMLGIEKSENLQMRRTIDEMFMDLGEEVQK